MGENREAGSPRVSVIIPCYGQAHFLPDAIGSALRQSHPASEVIVVDDGSPDDVGGVVDRYPEVRLITQENRGLSGARNAGLKASSGDFVVFLDADDRLMPTALAVGVGVLVGHPGVAFTWGFNLPIDQEGRVSGPVSNPHPVGKATYEALLTQNIVGPPVGVMFRRSVIDAVGGFSTAASTAEDYELYLRVARAHSIYCHGDVVAEYRYHATNMSGDRVAMLQGVLQALDLQVAHTDADPRLRAALKRGRRDAHVRFDGRRRVEALGADLRSGRWVAAAFGALSVLLRYPSLFIRTARDRLRAKVGGT